MKTTVTSFLLLLFASATLSSCESCGDITITEPTVEDTKWLVYGQNDTALFKITDGGTVDTLTYLRTGTYVQNVPGAGYSINDECIDKRDTQLTNIIEDKERKLPYMGTYILKKPDSLIVKIGVGSKVAWEIKNTDVPQPVQVNGDDYNAYVYTATPTADNDPKLVYFNKEYGFLRVELKNGKTLELIELKTKTTP
ncbi:hypothetical protein [Pontibacter chinhatensis]|uniref:Lipocalin-like domain-containing protein n=1 Tax=Pontibacter chinhatensis TaxID=1436961 RepID=A0A1I2WQP7_9BACT|nr:hypothetical protein [Pontibacter chinhatensis]SFH02959.1 hypothetical protein SAMN05421739_105130 [Pontibacter chinhatensis]